MNEKKCMRVFNAVCKRVGTHPLHANTLTNVYYSVQIFLEYK